MGMSYIKINVKFDRNAPIFNKHIPSNNFHIFLNIHDTIGCQSDSWIVNGCVEGCHLTAFKTINDSEVVLKLHIQNHKS